MTLVLVVGRGEGADAYELIRLDGQGEVLERRTMLEGGGVSSIYKVFATDAGYVLREDGPDGFTPLRYTLFDFHGEMVRQMDGWEDAPLPAELGRNAFFRIARRHTLRDEGERTVLTALDAQGNETLLAELQGTRGDGRTQTGWVDLISLDDGGAAVAGRAFDGRVRKGRIARWDAQGNPVFDWWLETGELMKLAQTNDGFVALMLPVFDLDAEMPERREWTLARFNDDGVQTGGVSLGEMDEFVTADMLALLPDGSVVVAYTDFDRDSAGDVCVIAVPAEGADAVANESESAAPARETYFINPNGGRRYHTLAQCASIDEKYWPGMREVTAQWLEQAAMYERCEYCGAPPLN